MQQQKHKEETQEHGGCAVQVPDTAAIKAKIDAALQQDAITFTCHCGVTSADEGGVCWVKSRKAA